MRTLSFAVLAATAAIPISNAASSTPVGVAVGVPAPVQVREAPPARVAERAVAAPGPGYVWLPGRHTWTGDRWNWIPGAWVIPPRPDARWVDGVWNPNTQQWVEGHWEIPATIAPAPTVVTSPPIASSPTVVVPTTPAPALTAPPAPPSNELIVLEPPPPPPEPEVRTPPPGPGYVWISGYWGWENGKRQWFRGHWERPPRGYRVWVAPRWEKRPNGYAFVRGYWM